MKKFSISMVSSLVPGASLSPLHLLKRTVVARRISILASSMPKQIRDPAPKGEKRSFCRGVSLLWSKNLVSSKLCCP